MREVANPETFSFHGSQYVYMLPLADRTRVKIGRSRTPLDRISSLYANHPEIDLTRAALIEVDSHRLESVLHTVFGTHRAPLEVQTDGYTEWFQGDLIDEAIEFCQLVAEKRRGCPYPVMRNLLAEVQAYCAANPNAGAEKPRRIVEARQLSAAELRSELIDQALERTEDLIDLLSEKPLDGVMTHEGADYLVRTVDLQAEPKIEPSASYFAATEWGQQVADSAVVQLENEAVLAFRLLEYVDFRKIDPHRGFEIFRVIHTGQRPPEFEPVTRAIDALWQYLDTLAPIDPAILQAILKA